MKKTNRWKDKKIERQKESWVKGQGKRWEGTFVGQSPQGKAQDEIEKGQDEEGHDEKGQNKKGQVEKSQNVKTKRWTDEKTKRVKSKRDKKGLNKKGEEGPWLFSSFCLDHFVFWSWPFSYFCLFVFLVRFWNSSFDLSLVPKLLFLFRSKG